jgi:hypothetical protein
MLLKYHEDATVRVFNASDGAPAAVYLPIFAGFT